MKCLAFQLAFVLALAQWARADLTLTQSGTTPSFANTGTVTIATGRTWTVSNGALNQNAGTIGGAGTLSLSSATASFAADFTNSLTGVQLILRHIVDDGAVFYLNGQEVYRYGMPAGPMVYTNTATFNIGVPTNAGPFDISATNLIIGTNILAVEVHQYFPSSFNLNRDTVFGADLVSSEVLTPAIPPIPALPPTPTPEAWVELYNRSTNTVNLTGWQFDQGINYAFPNGKTIAPGGYLVVANDATNLQAHYPAIDVLGDFTGSRWNE